MFPGSNRILNFVILSVVFTPILPKPIEERANSAATALGQIEFPRGQFRNMPRFCSEDRLDRSAEAEQGR